MKKDYCTAFPEEISGTNISQCCKAHDRECGTYSKVSFITAKTNFYNCLKSKVGKIWAVIITTGGTIGCGVLYPYILYKRKQLNKEI